MAFHASMAEALRLTRSGRLMEATAMLQAALGSGTPFQAAPTTPGAGPEDVIDLVPERISFGTAGSAGSDAADSTPPRAVSIEAASFEERTYRGAQAEMSYRLYRPARLVDGMPLVVMLHGCTQSPEDFARGTGMNRLADELGFLVAYPRQTQRANIQKCWNWFRPGDQQRDQGEPALLAGVTRQVIAEHRVDSGRVYVAGLSAGGAAAAIMAARYPDLYAAVGIHSGLACGAARDLSSAMTAMQRGGGKASPTGAGTFVPLITFHGDRDTTVHEVNSREIVATASRAAGVPLDTRTEQGRSPAGRSFTRQSSADPAGTILIEQWTVEGAGHAWSGGDAAGSYTDPSGPDASREMMRFFLATKRG